MNVLHINSSDIIGGAAIAAYRLHKGLITKKIDSKLLVGSKNIKDTCIDEFYLKSTIDSLLYKLTWKLGLNQTNYISSFKLRNHPFYKQSDIINFHLLHTIPFNYLTIPWLTKNKPAVITLHDMWCFTGHCSYSFDCERWKIGCGSCPDLTIYPAISRDSTGYELKLKEWVYKNSNLTIVCPSKWLYDQAKESILKKLSIHYIAHGIDTELYKPYKKLESRSKLGIDKEKIILMLGADNLTDYRKGGDLFLEALNYLPISIKNNLNILTIGAEGDKLKKEFSGIVSINLGYITDDYIKALAFSASDLFVFPTRADIFGLVLLESMSCGTPLVSFDVGGVTDLVRNNITGYLAKPEDPKDLASGITRLIEDSALYKDLSNNCREIAIKEFTIKNQASKYIELYESLLN